jgi:hypothetical protein
MPLMLEKNKGVRKYRFLLFDPADKKNLLRQIAFKKGVSLDKHIENMEEGLKKEIESEV